MVLIVTVGSWNLSKTLTRTLKLDKYFGTKESDGLYRLHKTSQILHWQKLIRLHTLRPRKSVPSVTSAYLRSQFGANIVLFDYVIHFFSLQLCFKNFINKGYGHKKMWSLFSGTILIKISLTKIVFQIHRC